MRKTVPIMTFRQRSLQLVNKSVDVKLKSLLPRETSLKKATVDTLFAKKMTMLRMSSQS